MKQELETWRDVRRLIYRFLLVCFALWVGVDYVWYLRGWEVVRPHCAFAARPHATYILEGETTPVLSQALIAYMARTINPAAMRLNDGGQVEVRPALFYSVGPDFGGYFKGAVQLIEGDDGPDPFQSPPVFCEHLERYLLPWTGMFERKRLSWGGSFNVYVFLFWPGFDEYDALIARY
jgi:hypothetical protein